MAGGAISSSRSSAIVLVVSVAGFSFAWACEVDGGPTGTSQPIAPRAQLDYEADRGHEPGRGELTCTAADQDGNLQSLTLQGHNTSNTQTNLEGSSGTVTADVNNLSAGDHDYSCRARDGSGLADTSFVTVSVTENQPPPSILTVTGQWRYWTLTQTATDDPNQDEVTFSLLVEGPQEVSIGPRGEPIDTTLVLTVGSYAARGIASDGFRADTSIVMFEAVVPITQTVIRDGITFQYMGTVEADEYTLEFVKGQDVLFSTTRSANLDTVFAGPVDGDTNGLFKGDDYLFVVVATLNDSTATDTVDAEIPNFGPTVDLSEVDSDLDEEAVITVDLPTPTDPNREDEPTYSGAVSLASVIHPLSRVSMILEPEGFVVA